MSNGVGPPARPVLAGFGMRPSAPGKDGEMLVPQRRDVVVLLAAGPTSATAVPRHPGTVSKAAENSYVYYTAIPRFCAVTASTGNLVLPTSNVSLAGGLVNTVWAPGTVIHAPIVPRSETSDSAVSQDAVTNLRLVGDADAVVLSTASNCGAVWTPMVDLVGGAVTPGDVASRAAASSNGCTGSDEGGDACRTYKDEPEDATAVAVSGPAPTSASPVARDPSASDGVEVAASSTTSRTFTCCECSRDFGSEKYLNMHMSLHLQSSALAPQRCANEASTSPTPHRGPPDVSASTTMVLTSQQQLMMAPPPIRRTKTTTSGVGGTSCTSQWTCQICEKTFAQNSNYKNHIRTHSNERPFVCEICAIGYFYVRDFGPGRGLVVLIVTSSLRVQKSLRFLFSIGMSLCNREASVVRLSVCPSVCLSVCKLCANRYFYHRTGWIATKLAHDGPQMGPHSGCAQCQGQGQRSRDRGTFLRTLKSLLLPQT